MHKNWTNPRPNFIETHQNKQKPKTYNNKSKKGKVIPGHKKLQQIGIHTILAYKFKWVNPMKKKISHKHTIHRDEHEIAGTELPVW